MHDEECLTECQRCENFLWKEAQVHRPFVREDTTKVKRAAEVCARVRGEEWQGDQHLHDNDQGDALRGAEGAERAYQEEEERRSE